MLKVYFEEVHNEIKQHALSEYPNECCGLIIQGKTKLIYQKCRNVAENKEEHYELHVEDYIKASNRGEIKAIIHSHNDFPHASKHDLQEESRHQVPFGIVFIKNGAVQDLCFWGDGLPIQNYVGRPFHYGIYDCINLLRDYYRGELDILLPILPTDYGWWKDGQDVIMDNFKDFGFIDIGNNIKDLKVNDGIVFKINSKVVNHIAIYIGNNLILHHLCLSSSSLSRTEPLTSFNYKHIYTIFRHKEFN